MAARSADRAGVGRHGAELQAQALENALVGGVHDVVAALGAGLVAVERVGVLHGELAPAHQPEAGAAFVAELGLDMVEVQRQLAVALDLVARDVRDHFFRGRLQDEIALVAVLDAQQLRAVLFPAAGLHPEFGRLHHRHQQLDGAGCVHFLADNALDLTDDLQPQRHVGVDSARQLANHAGPRHQLVAGDLGLGRGFFQSVQVVLGGAHS